jgi:carbonic anhydrase/acetyltransferase-like protein (isoleucine patch superfamily)
MIAAFNGRAPVIDASAYVHGSANVIGDVEIGAEASLWFNVVVRGDVHHVRIGARTNLQDLTTVHVTGGRWPTIIGAEVRVGHRAVLHGCAVGDRCLIGIGAVILDGAELEPECMIAAASLVAPRTKIPAGHLAMGAPAKVVRPLRPEELAHLRESAARYAGYAAAYRAHGIV